MENLDHVSIISFDSFSVTDEVVPETPSTPALGSQPPAQGNASTDVSTPVAAGEKRPAPTSMETPTPGKRPRSVLTDPPALTLEV